MSAITVLDEKNLTFGIMSLGRRGDSPGTVKQMVHDGDTINVRPDGNLGVRFLGIDTPEVSFRPPGDTRFLPLNHAIWDEFLSDPFAERFGPFDQPMPAPLKRHLEGRVGSGVAANHLKHARAAEDFLEAEITKDMRILNQSAEMFRFFLAFAFASPVDLQ